jgi:hypothetical protein
VVAQGCDERYVLVWTYYNYRSILRVDAEGLICMSVAVVVAFVVDVYLVEI